MLIRGHLPPLSHAQSITTKSVLEEIKLSLFLGHLETSGFSQPRELFDPWSSQRPHLYSETGLVANSGSRSRRNGENLSGGTWLHFMKARLSMRCRKTKEINEFRHSVTHRKDRSKTSGYLILRWSIGWFSDEMLLKCALFVAGKTWPRQVNPWSHCYSVDFKLRKRRFPFDSHCKKTLIAYFKYC